MTSDLWVYKCSRKLKPYSRAYGDWREVFEKNKVVQWGGSWCTKNNVSIHILNELLKPGDLILAYQTDDRVLVGLCRVAKIVGGKGDRKLWLQPVDYFPQPIPIHDLKKDRKELREIEAFAPGFAQTIYSVSPKEKAILKRLCRANVMAKTNEPVLPPKLPVAGAGFGTYAENKVVERAAVKAVRAWYRHRGWQVKSVEAAKCGYDLQCSRRNVMQHVEVKGIAGSEPCFLITAAEKNQAESNSSFVICVVTSATAKRPKILKLTGHDLCRQYEFKAIQYRARPL